MVPIRRPMKVAALALFLSGVCGCQESNEKNFTDKPGSAPPGAPVDGEVIQPEKKNKKGEYIRE